MSIIRSILAVLFAILIANPACCCTPRKEAEPAQSHHCCGGTKKEQKEAPQHCACPSTSPKQLEDPPVIPVFSPIELPPVLASFEELRIPEVPEREVPVADFRCGTGPPLRRLAMLQRFLI
ncbi:hypothetical protein OJ996_06615 [Luteolibacter sp. GHJ8]|uniref:Secreted protein n=1 Tax=Luteolibacter rhizosphaerae TaxID=2989719 RepID=A0ABT3G1W3_9BACT|nr:hypothetical protein [Luteolibacter rhizosphaerae]MCW1913235.1 hypothetical protein [Luteolibacter rhizosphaerae]